MSDSRLTMPASDDGHAHSMPEAVHAALPALFISDLHLAEDETDTVTAFTDFLDGPARDAGSLFILGDLFEYWAGDDDLDAPLNQRICTALSTLANTGVQIYFISGNRDLLAGPVFARAAGLRLLPDPAQVQLGTERVLLSHGDILCTDDLAYQAYRKQVRDPAWQANFLAQPLATRKTFIEHLRQQSNAAKQEKAMRIMDVNTGAVEALLRQHGGPVLIHGHTHRPARHTHRIDGQECMRWVLSDWHGVASWLAYDGRRFAAIGQPGN